MRSCTFQNAFHGRAGYTLSVTNTDPAKTQYFPKFDWPRIPAPVARFPLSGGNLEATLAAEAEATRAIERAFDERAHRIAAILIEPIQGEGGDGHFRAEFLATLRRFADEREALLIFDEVQCGGGTTGSWWAHEYANLRPDLITFAKKMQVGGFLASTYRRGRQRVQDPEPDQQHLGRRTRGHGALDARARDHHRRSAARERAGARRRAPTRARSAGLGFPSGISNARGRGLFAAVDLPSTTERNAFLKRCFEEQLLVLGGGLFTVRFRPSRARSERRSLARARQVAPRAARVLVGFVLGFRCPNCLARVLFWVSVPDTHRAVLFWVSVPDTHRDSRSLKSARAGLAGSTVPWPLRVIVICSRQDFWPLGATSRALAGLSSPRRRRAFSVSPATLAESSRCARSPTA